MNNDAPAWEPLRLNGRELRRRRILAGLNQEDLAGKAGVTRWHVSLLERGARGTTPRTLAAIAGALDCSAADLVAAGDGDGAE